MNAKEYLEKFRGEKGVSPSENWTNKELFEFAEAYFQSKVDAITDHDIDLLASCVDFGHWGDESWYKRGIIDFKQELKK